MGRHLRAGKFGAPTKDRSLLGWSGLFRLLLSVFIGVHRWLN